MTELTPTFSKGFSDGLQRLYDADEGDVKIVCGALNKNLHSLILGARSKVFDAMLKSPFKEGQSKHIELEEESPHLVARMLQHLYGFDYSGHKISIGADEEPSHVSELHTHVTMYAMGDRYDIEDLKEEALWKFKKAIEAKKGQVDEFPYFVEVIPTVYATTPDSDRGLRDIVVAFGVLNLERMKDLPEFKSAAIRVPIYLIEVLPRFFTRLENERSGRKVNCPKCKKANQREYTWISCSHCG